MTFEAAEADLRMQMELGSVTLHLIPISDDSVRVELRTENIRISSVKLYGYGGVRQGRLAGCTRSLDQLWDDSMRRNTVHLWWSMLNQTIRVEAF